MRHLKYIPWFLALFPSYVKKLITFISTLNSFEVKYLNKYDNLGIFVCIFMLVLPCVSKFFSIRFQVKFLLGRWLVKNKNKIIEHKISNSEDKIAPSDRKDFNLHKTDWLFFCTKKASNQVRPWGLSLNFQNCLVKATVHRGVICQFPFRWIYYYGTK